MPIIKIKKIFFLFIIIFFTSTLYSKANYTPFIKKQISYSMAMNENNITQETINEILLNQQKDFYETLKSLIKNKNTFLKTSDLYNNEIFALQKIIKINKRAGNTFAIIRDEVQVKSYKLLVNQNIMLLSILGSLNYPDKKSFLEAMEKSIIQNQKDNTKLYSVDYKPYLEINSPSKTLKQAKININDFYALQDVNLNIINYLYMFKDTIYSLNKYSKLHILTPVLFIQSTSLASTIDQILRPYNLNIVKIIIILFLIIIIYIIRKFIISATERFILEIESLKKYPKQLLMAITKPIDILILIININLVLYVYNNFTDGIIFVKLFNILYVLIFTIIIYRVANVVASIKIQDINAGDKKVKNEIINISIKIINFTILIIGLLLVLHFAGADLTAILSGLGIGGFAVALAAKDSLANFFGTLSILFSDTFSQGDWITSNGKEGTVVEIGLRVTTLRTFDNAIVSIPNSVLANSDIKNWNKRKLGRRIKMSLGIKYDSKSQDIQNAIIDIRKMLNDHKNIATEHTSYKFDTKTSAKLVSKADAEGIKKTLLVFLDEFSDSSINILIYCFSKTVQWDEWLAVKEDIMFKIMKILEKNNLEFAFPSLSIYNE